MKIVHIHLLGPYTDGWGYQENILPKIQARQGNEVYVIASTLSHSSNGTLIEKEVSEYITDNVKIIRLKINKWFVSQKFNNLFCDYSVYELLCSINPDVILLHGLGLGFLNFRIHKFIKKHKDNCVLYGDVHATYLNTIGNNSNIFSIIAREWDVLSKKILFKYYRKIFCITPECIKYAINEYHVPDKKIELFPLGFDPVICDIKNKVRKKDEFRKKYGFSSEDIIIAHGGKIIPRRNTEKTIEAVRIASKKYKNIKLLIFGEIDSEIAPSILHLISDCADFVTYFGHLSQAEYIDLFMASDIGLFPGAESALWQEAIGTGLPLIVGNNGNLNYLDVGGNILFVDKNNTADIVSKLSLALQNNNYLNMKVVAELKGREFFSYERMADMMLER